MCCHVGLGGRSGECILFVCLRCCSCSRFPSHLHLQINTGFHSFHDSRKGVSIFTDRVKRRREGGTDGGSISEVGSAVAKLGGAYCLPAWFNVAQTVLPSTNGPISGMGLFRLSE